jgi:hypothetical protein
MWVKLSNNMVASSGFKTMIITIFILTLTQVMVSELNANIAFPSMNANHVEIGS